MSRLHESLDKLVERINQTNTTLNEDNVTAMANLLLLNNSYSEITSKNHVNEIATRYMIAISQLPQMISQLRYLLENNKFRPELRHAIILTLVYLVRNDKLLPDDFPKELGLIDDYIVLRLAQSCALIDYSVRAWSVMSLSNDKEECVRLMAEFEDWIHASSTVLLILTSGLPANRKFEFGKLGSDIIDTFTKLAAWVSVDPFYLNRHMQILIDNPFSLRQILTHPLDDEIVWRQWERGVQLEKQEAMRKAERKKMATYQMLNLEQLTNRFITDDFYRSTPVLGGGWLASDGRSVYYTPKPN